MRWSKGAAAVLAALLLLTTAVRAGEADKAPAREERPILNVRLTLPGETEEAAKLPVMTVIKPEEAKQAGMTVVTPEPVKSQGGSGTEPSPRPEVSPKPAEPRDPVFPEAEDWQILLVNPWNELPEDFEVTLKTLPDGQKVDERAYEDLNAMLEACREAGLRPKICSAYRTQSKQTYLYNNKIARLRNAGYSRKPAEAEAGRWVARPGTSEHQLGLALDIVSQSYQALTKKQEKTAEQKWLMEHCWEYGFILRYPNDKSEITGIGYEPWHYRYVGREVALDIRDSGLCMEEYLLLREEALAAEHTA